MANYRKEKSLHRAVAQQQRQNQRRRQDACLTEEILQAEADLADVHQEE